MTQYVIIYNRATGTSVITEFAGVSAAEDALRARFAAEHLVGVNEEVAVLTAKSQRDLARTHSRYFTGVRGAIENLTAASA